MASTQKSVSAVLADIFKITSVAAENAAPVFIVGSGADFFARRLHFDGVRREKPFLKIRCPVPEAEFKKKINSALEGTVFLSEISLLEKSCQALFARAMQNPRCPRLVASSVSEPEALKASGLLEERLALAFFGGVVFRVPKTQEPSLQKEDFPQEMRDLFFLWTREGRLPLRRAKDFFKKAYIQSVLQDEKFNQTKAAKILGVQRTYLSRLLGELEIKK